MIDCDNINSALKCLREFKQSYKEENGVVTIGSIRDLIDNIDLIENCVMKQKAIPVKPEKHFKLFGEMEWIKHCQCCGAVVYPEREEQFCIECGQKCCG